MKRMARIFVLWLWAALAAAQAIPGFRDATAERAREKQFLQAPDPHRAEQHLRTLTAAPHVAGSPEDRATAEYVAQRFREAGLETEIVEYRIWMNLPGDISVDMTAPPGVVMHGPTREHVYADPFQDDRRVLPAFNGYSPSGDVEAEVVYVNYARPEDLAKLKQYGVDPRGKILLARYGQNFRGVKALVAQENGAAGLLLYSDPMDDGWFKGDKYPQGPWRPDTGVQRGSVAFTFEFPGDPTTPGIPSLPGLPDAQRTPPERSAALTKVPTTPLSYLDAWPMMQHLGGPAAPRDWQGALPFTYHLGGGPARVKMHLKQDYAYRTIWDVVGRVKGSESPDEWVIAGNHRDAWVYGAVDPGSGTAAMLETVHGIGELLKSGWRPRRTIVFASWDAEEQGLIGSTEWAEQHERDLSRAVAYFNMDVAVSGPTFGASAVPSLKNFVREITKAVAAPNGGTVYQAWVASQRPVGDRATSPQGSDHAQTQLSPQEQAPVGDLGSGSDYSVFLQHLGVPSLDMASHGAYGVYHSVFDNFEWFKKFGDPQFVYEQQMARILGLGVLRMADTDVLPYDYEEYGKAITSYLETARRRADEKFGSKAPSFAAAEAATSRLVANAAAIKLAEKAAADPKQLNDALLRAERGFLMPDGLPHRPWFRHAIYAPGEYTGYAAVVLPGINEAIDQGDAARAAQQLANVTAAIQRAAEALELGR
jgi:N-acetylated-alpha-linked acidic dipeptidase